MKYWMKSTGLQLVILDNSAAQPSPNGRLSCLHSLKIFWPRKQSYISNQISDYEAHYDVLMLYLYILKKSFLVNQIDDFPSSNKKYSSSLVKSHRFDRWFNYDFIKIWGYCAQLGFFPFCGRNDNSTGIAHPERLFQIDDRPEGTYTKKTGSGGL